MKKLVLAAALLVATGVASAKCPDNAQKIVDRVKSHNVTAINVTYSADQETWAQDLKKNIAGVDSALTVNLVPTTGSNICKVSKA